MNTLIGEIVEITEHNSLTLVRAEVNSIALTAVVLDTPSTADYLKIGNKVNIIFKETEVIIATGAALKISLQNRFKGPVKSIEFGELLSKVVVASAAGEITSIITTNATKQLELESGTEVTALVKTNEMMLSPI